MKRLGIFIAVMAALAILPATATADWYEQFDTYAPGSGLAGQGGWEVWNPGGGDALVSNAYSMSPTNSVEVTGPTDLVHQYTGYTSGTWTYTAWLYIPGDYTGDPDPTYFIMLCNYDPPNHDNSVWSVQMNFNSDGFIHGWFGGSEVTGPAYVKGQWAEIRVEIYLDVTGTWAQVYYNDQLIDDPAVPDHPQLGGGYKWAKGVFGNQHGTANIACVDLFANNATPVYYDDMSLEPASLSVDTHEIPETTGGKVNFTLDAGPGNANRDYLLLGSITGTSPGTPLPGGQVTLPLNWDIFTGLIINLINTPVFANFMGKLDGNGEASATFDTLGPISGATGLMMHFAYALPNPWDFVSKAVPVQIVP